MVSKNSLDSVKDCEKIIDALELCAKREKDIEEYNLGMFHDWVDLFRVTWSRLIRIEVAEAKKLKVKNPIIPEPEPNPLMLDKTCEDYLLYILTKQVCLDWDSIRFFSSFLDQACEFRIFNLHPVTLTSMANGFEKLFPIAYYNEMFIIVWISFHFLKL